MSRKSFTPELFYAEGWKNITLDGETITGVFIRHNRLFYLYEDGSEDYYNCTLPKAALTVSLYYVDQPIRSGVRTVGVRAFLESNGKLRFWTTDWQVTQPMLEAAPYFHSWVGVNYPVCVNAIEKYANVK